MFISKQEKIEILSRIAVLEEMVKTLFKERREKTERRKQGWTDEARARHSERLKKAWANKKEQEQA